MMERGFKLGLLWRAAPVVAHAGVLHPASLSGFWTKGRWVLAQGKGEVPVVVARKLGSSIGVLRPMIRAMTISCSVLLTASCFTVAASLA